MPTEDREVCDILLASRTVLPIGAQSSLTGGSTPMGETVLSTARMSRVLSVSPHRIEVQPGVTVAAMQEVLAQVDAWFPPAPTFTGAFAGGIVATNAAGAATFKYGSTRQWVEAIRVVLADGTVLDVKRGDRKARAGALPVDTRRGRVDVPVPRYRMPAVAKRSAGYHAEPEMDLIDLFIGSEGTLGVITRVAFRALSPAPRSALALVFCPDEPTGLRLVSALRQASQRTWVAGDPAGIDIAGIEHMDRRSLELLCEDGADRIHNIRIPGAAALALLVDLELPAGTTDDAAFGDIEESLRNESLDSPIARFCRMLDAFGVLGDTELVLPGHLRRRRDLLAVREAVPTGVNHRVALARTSIDSRIEKTAADMIVPFDSFAEMMQVYRREFEGRGLDYAVWGHISDGNVHPNVIPSRVEDVREGRNAILEFGRAVARLGGCPLAEHGVGRNPIKQALLAQLYGESGLEEMRAVKRALDPEWKLAPGVIFQRSRPM